MIASGSSGGGGDVPSLCRADDLRGCRGGHRGASGVVQWLWSRTQPGILSHSAGL